jgi:ribosomal protein L29
VVVLLLGTAPWYTAEETVRNERSGNIMACLHVFNPKFNAQYCRTEFPTAEAVQGEVDRLRSEMFTMRIKFAKREEYQPAQYKALRKRVAQLLTIQRERTLEQGVTRREARALERRTLVEAGLRQF